jgi:hypothetical protein
MEVIWTLYCLIFLQTTVGLSNSYASKTSTTFDAEGAVVAIVDVLHITHAAVAIVSKILEPQ